MNTFVWQCKNHVLYEFCRLFELLIFLDVAVYVYIYNLWWLPLMKINKSFDFGLWRFFTMNWSIVSSVNWKALVSLTPHKYTRHFSFYLGNYPTLQTHTTLLYLLWLLSRQTNTTLFTLVTTMLHKISPFTLITVTPHKRPSFYFDKYHATQNISLLW